MRLFYDPHIDKQTKLHTLTEEESKHAIRVLRMQMGDALVLLNGKGDRFECEISEANPKKCQVKILRHIHEAKPTASIHIAVGPTKQVERMEWFVEKATEIGVTHITFIQCTNSERVKLKLDRLEKKAISAMKQSQRTYLPELSDLVNFETFVNEHPGGLIAHCYEGEKHSIAEVFTPQDCPILIGPEGDFSEKEVALAAGHAYKIITLGANRLRTETAALYACMQAKLSTE